MKRIVFWAVTSYKSEIAYTSGLKSNSSKNPVEAGGKLSSP
jgi:hypothetical protein